MLQPPLPAEGVGGQSPKSHRTAGIPGTFGGSQWEGGAVGQDAGKADPEGTQDAVVFSVHDSA